MLFGKKNKTMLASAAILTSSLTFSANAELVNSVDDNNNVTVINTATGVEWLSFEATKNMTFNEVLDAMENTDIFSGWRLPTEQEVARLMETSIGSNGIDVYVENATYRSGDVRNPLFDYIDAFRGGLTTRPATTTVAWHYLREDGTLQAAGSYLNGSSYLYMLGMNYDNNSSQLKTGDPDKVYNDKPFYWTGTYLISISAPIYGTVTPGYERYMKANDVTSPLTGGALAFMVSGLLLGRRASTK